MKLRHTADYAALRRAAYPGPAVLADALFWDSQGQPAKLRAYYAACAAVKAKFPKPEPGDPVVPQRVTRRQARQALLERGLLQLVDQAIEQISDPLQRERMRIDWNDAVDFERTDTTLLALAQLLGLTNEDLDNLFVLAASFATTTIQQEEDHGTLV